MQFCQVADAGVAVVYQFIDQSSGLPANIFLATALKIRIQKPDGTGVELAAALYTDGLDGKIVYVTQSGDLPEVGIYSMQGKLTLNSLPISGEVKQFEVRSNTVVS